MKNQRAIRKALALAVISLTVDTALVLGLAERKLLAQFLRGVITLDQLRWLAEERIQTAQAIDELNKLTAGAIS